MNATSNATTRVGTDRKERSSEFRDIRTRPGFQWQHHEPVPAAGAHAASHLINEDATPGAGALPSYSRFGREVDGGAG